MKKIVLLAVTLIFGLSFNAQDNLVPDQNPNYKKSLERFENSTNEYSILQGTTAQETYKAIDPLQDKRDLKAIRKQHRANRPLWRHQERMARIKNTTYIDSGYGFNRNNNFYGNSFRNYGYNRGFRNNFVNPNSLLTLGLMGCILRD